MQRMDSSKANVTNNKIRRLYAGLKSSMESGEVSERDMRGWKNTTAQLFKEFDAFQKSAALSEERSRSELAIMREEMRDELVSREAINARTAERFRAFSERIASVNESTFDRATQTACTIEASIANICRSALSVNQGTGLLYEQTRQNGT